MSATELSVPVTGNNSGMCSPNTVPPSRSNSALDTRLYLPVKEAMVGELGLRLLPEGDALPRWYNMSLLRKLPMFPHPEDAVQYSTAPLCEQLYVNKKKIDFDLSDPNNYLINTEYNSLNDPWLKSYFYQDKHLRVLQNKGMLTSEGRVRCSVKEFNRYRRWLKHIGMMEYQKMRDDERQRELNMKNKLNVPSDFLEVAVIETQLHEEEVRQRRQEQEDAKESGGRVKQLELVRHTAAIERSRLERYGPDSDKTREKEDHRATTYERAMKLDRKRKRDKLRNYHSKLKKYLVHLKEVEDSKNSGKEQKLVEDWKRMKDYQQQYEDTVRDRRERDDERADRYRRLLSLEMNRRWHEQAGKINERRERAKLRQNNLEETYARNIAHAFATSRVFNPEGYDKAMKAITAGPHKDQELMEEPVDDDNKTTEETGEGRQAEEDSLPALKTVRYKDQRSSGASLAAFDQPLQSLGLDVHLRSIGDVPADEQQKQLKALADLQKRVSGETVVRLPGVKKKPQLRLQHVPKEKHAYPTTTRHFTGDEPEEDVVCIFKPQELIEGMPELEDGEHGEGTPPLSLLEPMGRGSIARRATLCQGLTYEERETLEKLLERLLRDLNAGTLEPQDLITLAALCAALTANQLMQENLGEVATSTTSLVPPGLQAAVGSGDISATSSLSSGLDGYLAHTIDKAIAERDNMEDLYGTMLVEEVIKNTVCQMANDLRDGTLSREDVREIGSAMASVVMGEVRSDISLLAENVVVPTLEQLLRDAEEIDEVLLDQTMASLLATYNQVTRRTDRMVWQVLKDFAVEVLLRTKSALIKGVLPMMEFIEATYVCRKTPLQAQLELPCEHELIKVMTTAITKLAGVHKFSPVLCDLMRIVLDQGQTMLVERHGADKLALPKIDSAILLTLGESACGVEVALEVAATVSDGLYRDMLIDPRFEESLRLTLAPAFFLVLLSCWGEMMAIVDKENVALQTTAKDVEFTPSVAESVILQSLCMLHKAVVVGDDLSDGVITLLALHIAEFPIFIPVSSLTDADDKGKMRLPLYVVRKMERLATNVLEDLLEPKQVKKLLAVVVHIFVREVLTAQPSQVPELVAESKAEIRIHVRNLVTNLLHKSLECVQAQVWNRLSPQQNVQTVVGMTQVKQVMQVMADAAVSDLRRSARVGISPSDGGESQLEDIVKAAVKIDPERRQPWPPYSIPEFLNILVKVIDSQKTEHVVLSVKHESTWRVVQIIRVELAALAQEIVSLFGGMAILQQQQLMEPCPLLHKMLTFIIAILMELKHALQTSVLPLSVAYDFLHSVAKELCGPECKSSASALDKVITALVQDLEWKRDKSFYFKRLTTTLSRLSLEKEAEDVAESMAATAHMLSTINTSILTQFVQTTLLSLLNNLRINRPSPETPAKAPPLLSDDETNNRDIRVPTVTVIETGKEDEESVVDEKELELNRKRLALNTNLAKANEIRHETDIIAHTIIQTMLESLEAQQEELSVSAAHDSDKETPTVKEHFQHLERDLALYAQSIVTEMTEKVEKEEEKAETETLAVLIFNKTFGSIQSGLASGKLQLLRTPSSSDLEGQSAPSSAHGSQLSSYMVSTLSAVHQELLELHKQSPPNENSTNSTESSQTFKIASDMANYITKRVQTDAESGKVRWTLTKDQKLKVVSDLDETPDQQDYITADCVRQTFRDVMVEQYNQNQFFCPESSESGSSSGQVRSVLMPGLPYLLDEFILSNLLQVAESLCKVGNKEQTLSVLNIEAVVVATTFYQVIRDMMLKTVEQDPANRQECRKTARQTFVLEVLSDSLREVLDVAPDAQLAIDFLSATQSEVQRVGSDSLDETPSGFQHCPSMTMKCDLAKLMTSIENMNVAARQARSSVSTMEVEGLLDVVVDALQSVIDKLVNGLVEEEDINFLSKVLYTGLSKQEPRPERIRAVVRELKVLLDGVHEGTIPPEVLRETADYLNSLEPGQRTDPRFVGQVVKKFATSSACVLPDCLKRAVQDLLSGMQPSSVPGVKPGVRTFPSATLTHSSSSRSVAGRISSLHARTVSKTFVGDKTDNREYPETTLYSANVVLGSPVPGFVEEKEANDISYGNFLEEARKYQGRRRVSFPDEASQEETDEDVEASPVESITEVGERLTDQQAEGDNQQAAIVNKEQPALPGDLQAQMADENVEGDNTTAGEVRRATTGPGEDGERKKAGKGVEKVVDFLEDAENKLSGGKVEKVAADSSPGPRDEAERKPDSEDVDKETLEDIRRDSLKDEAERKPDSEDVDKEMPDELGVEQVPSNTSRITPEDGPEEENSNRSAARGLRRDCVSRIDELQTADEKAGNTNREAEGQLATSYQRLFSYLAQRSEAKEEKVPRQPTAPPKPTPAAAHSQSSSQQGGPESEKKAPKPPGASSTTTMKQATYRSRDGRTTHTTVQMTSERQEEDETVCVRRTGSMTMRRFSLSLNNNGGGGGNPQPRPRRAANLYTPPRPGFTPADSSSGLTAKEVRAKQRAFWTGYGLFRNKSQNSTYPVFPQDTNVGESAEWHFFGKEWSTAGEKPPHVPHPPAFGSATQTASRRRRGSTAADLDSGRAGESGQSAGVSGQPRKLGRRVRELRPFHKLEEEFRQSGSVDGRHAATSPPCNGRMFASNADPYLASPKLKKRTKETITPKEARTSHSVNETYPCTSFLPVPPAKRSQGTSSRHINALAVKNLPAEDLGRLLSEGVKGRQRPPASDGQSRTEAKTRPLRHVRETDRRRHVSSLPPDSQQPTSYTSEKDLRRRYGPCLPPPRPGQTRFPRRFKKGSQTLKPGPEPSGSRENVGPPHPPLTTTSVSYSALAWSSVRVQRPPGGSMWSTPSGSPSVSWHSQPTGTRDRYMSRSLLDKRIAQALATRLRAIQSERNSAFTDSVWPGAGCTEEGVYPEV